LSARPEVAATLGAVELGADGAGVAEQAARKAPKMTLARPLLYFASAWEGRRIIFGAGLWRCLETAFIVFMGLGALAGLSYLYKPILRLIRKRARKQ